MNSDPLGIFSSFVVLDWAKEILDIFGFKSVDTNLLPSFLFFGMSRRGGQCFVFQVIADVTRTSVLPCNMSF